MTKYTVVYLDTPGREISVSIAPGIIYQFRAGHHQVVDEPTMRVCMELNANNSWQRDLFLILKGAQDEEKPAPKELKKVEDSLKTDEPPTPPPVSDPPTADVQSSDQGRKKQRKKARKEQN